jgi:hypothetical protein
MTTRNWLKWITGAAILLCSAAAFAQHQHINAGAVGGAGSQLYFVNGSNFNTNSGYVLELTPATNGPFAGLYHGSISFTALPATIFAGGPAFGHAQPGAYIELKMVSVTGPSGVFGFWLEDEDLGTAEKIFEMPAGTTDGTSMFNLSESDGAPDSDPYGHVHGRAFTLSEKGLYTVGFQLVDTSANGAGGGPVHQPSDIFYMYFRAGAPELAIHSIVYATNVVTVYAETVATSTYQLERATALVVGDTVWIPLGEPVSGQGGLHGFEDSDVNTPHRFYRLRITTP